MEKHNPSTRLLTLGARLSIDTACKNDHGSGGGIDGRRATFPQLFERET